MHVIAEEMLTELKSVLPAEQVCAVFLRIAEKTADEAPESLPGQSVANRLDQVAHFLTEKGYNARWEAQDGQYELHACNCPYIGIADRHHELCLMDQALMHNLLPGAVRHETRALNGAARCTYIIDLKPEKS